MFCTGPRSGRRVSAQFLVSPISISVDITVHQHGKYFIFIKYYAPSLRCCKELCGVNWCLLATMQSLLPLWLFEHSAPMKLCALKPMIRAVPHALVSATCMYVNTKFIACLDVY
jgi:hypothetical protein